MTIVKRIINTLPRVALIAALVLFPGAVQADFCAPPTPTPRDTPPQPDNPPSCGNPECETCNACPCFAKTGVYTTRATDLQIPTIGVPLIASRSYESSRVVDGALGYGWRSSFGARLYYATYLFASPSTFWKEAVLVMPDGESYRFREEANGSFTPPVGRRDTLVKAADGTFTLTIQQSNVRYSFAADGAPLAIKDDYGNTLRFTLDVSRRVVRVDDESGTGRYLILTWNPAGRLASVQDNGGRIVSYSYGSNGTLTSVTNPAGQSTIYTYEQRRFAPLLSRVTDHWNRVITDVTWDALDRVKSYSEAGETYTMSYLPADQFNPARTVKTHSKGSQTILYDANGLVTSRGGETTTYNANGDVLAQGNVTYTYTTGGRIATVSYGTDVTFHYTYDTLYPNKIAKIEPRLTSSPSSVYHGHWLGWKYTYYTPSDNVSGALAGEVKQIERMTFQHQTQTVLTDGDPVSIFAQVWYYSDGRLKRTWNRTDGDTFYYYDEVSRTRSIVRAANTTGRPTNYAFDSLGRTISITDSLGNVTSYEYDALDRLTKVTLPKPSPNSPLNFVTTFSYDNPGTNPALTYVHTTDPNNRVTKQGYDAFGRLAESTDQGGSTTIYSYVDGLLASISDANGNVTSYSYDSSRRLWRTTFPDGQSESYEHLPDGKLSAKTDRKGLRTTYQYDAYGRMYRQATGASQARALTFEGQKLTLISDSYGETTDITIYTYDSKTFRLLSEKQGAGNNTVRGTIDYTWGTNNDLIETYKVTDGDAPTDTQTVTYGYYADHSVKTIAWTRGPGTYRYTYNANGQPTKITFPNDQTRNFTYDNQGRLTQVSNLLGSTNLGTFDYEYDKDNDTGLFTVLGQRTKVTADVPALSTTKTRVEYFYDTKYQLTRARTTSTSTSEQSWTYDAIGNRLSQTAGASTTGYTYVKNGTNPNNSARLATVGTSPVSHDFNGNMTAFGSTTYTWDTLNRLKTRSASGTTHAFTYDGQDRRAKIDYQSTKFIYQGMNMVAMSYQKNGGYYASNYLFGPGIDEPLARVDSTGVTYYTVDGLGSVIMLSDGSGNVTNKYSYGPWGEVQIATEPLVQPFRYTARESAVIDSGTTERQYYYRARYMIPGIGRFVSEDQLRFQEGPNFYAYVRNDPVNSQDPSGLQAACVRSEWKPNGMRFQPGAVRTRWSLAREVELTVPVFVSGGPAPAYGWGAPVGRGDTLGAGWCMCVYNMSGALRQVDIFYRWRRSVTCQPCSAVREETRETPAGFMYREEPSMFANPAPQMVKGPVPCTFCRQEEVQ
jgi:RHS repeat-associated protein